VAEQDAAYFAEFYKKDKIRGGHIILLNPSDSSYYKETKRQILFCLISFILKTSAHNLLDLAIMDVYARSKFHPFSYFAEFYKKDKIRGGHIILLNPSDSSYYKETKRQALLALHTYPGGMQVGGGIHAENAKEFIEAGASHVIVTSYVFKDGKVNYNNLEKILAAVGKEHLVLDLSCRKKDGDYYIVTDRWQKFTEEKITPELLDKLKEYADEFLVHAVYV